MSKKYFCDICEDEVIEENIRTFFLTTHLDLCVLCYMDAEREKGKNYDKISEIETAYYEAQKKLEEEMLERLIERNRKTK